MGQGAIIGLDIGTRMMKYCEVRAGRDGAELISYGISPTPANCIATGVIIDPDTLGQAIREMLAAGGARTRRVNCAVTSPSALIVRPISLPKMTAAELAETMRWEVERYIPFAASEVVVDYKPLVAVEDLPAEETNMDVLLAAGQQEMIDAYVQTLAAARLEAVSLDVEPLSASRALIDINADRGTYEHTIALVSIGANSTDISIIRKGSLAFSRPVSIAGDNLTNAISDGMGREFEEAERLKVEEGTILFDSTVYRPAIAAPKAPEPAAPTVAPPTLGPPVIEISRPSEASSKPIFDLGEDVPAPPTLSQPAAPPPPVADSSLIPTAQTMGDTPGRRVFECMAPTLGELVTEIRRSLDFYASRSPQAPVDKVIVFGGTACLPHFAKFLSNELGLPVEGGDPFERVSIAGGFSEDLKALAPVFPVALGMGIRDMFD
jgi:type IV pilus assembly protein PilM